MNELIKITKNGSLL